MDITSNSFIPEGFGNSLLKDFVEITMPSPVSWWPQAPGWNIVAFIIVVFFLYRLSLWGQIWWRNRYRREAIAFVNNKITLHGKYAPETLRSLPLILKGTALKAYSNSTINSLKRDAWWKFVDSQYSGPGFEGVAADQLDRLAYSSEKDWQLTEQDIDSLLVMVKGWINQHQVFSNA